MASHIVLLGDSIFDNAAYTDGEPDVRAHLEDLLPPEWAASLRAVDGHTTREVPAQVRSVPASATHVALSVGGNDALLNDDLLDLPVSSTAEALLLFGERIAQFEASYQAALGATLALGLPTTVCTIYNGNLAPTEAARARIALMTFNDVILRAAFSRRVSVIDLRFICSEASDYANPIEPSGSGGRKIAEAIAKFCQAVDIGPRSEVYVGEREE